MKKKLQNNIQLMCNDHQIVICGRGEVGGGECQTLSVTFTLRTSLKDVQGHSNRTSGDIPTGCPAMFYFCIFT